MTLLGVNIDHIATVRQARRSAVPDILAAAQSAVAGGADSITVHLREDRRHVQDRDVATLRKSLAVRLNLEMAATDEMVRIARVVRPHSVCLVPERRQELTTEGGLDAKGQLARLRGVTEKLRAKGIVVSFFVDPDSAQVQAAKEAGADAVELHTGAYARATLAARPAELKKLLRVGESAKGMALVVNAGHGLDYANTTAVAQLAFVNELNIGFSIVARALFVGLERAVHEMKALVAPPGPPAPQPLPSAAPGGR
jgi:pyridoxine 5-phosphate synthase